MDDTEGNLSAHQPYDESPGGDDVDETPLISNRKSSQVAAGGAASMASPTAADAVPSSRTEHEFVISAPASLLLQRILSHDNNDNDNDGAEEYKEDVMTMNDGGNIIEWVASPFLIVCYLESVFCNVWEIKTRV